MKNRRKFLHQIAVAGISMPFSVKIPEYLSQSFTKDLNHDPDWDEIRSYFSASKHELINLNNGSSGVMPNPVLDKYIEYLRQINSFAPYHVFQGWEKACNENLFRLAQLINAKNGELAFVRNTTEAVNLILWGLNWNAGDEILKANWDYPLVDFTCERLKAEYKVNIRSIPENLYGLSDEEIVHLYENNITDKTKLIILTWITHREGQSLPVKKICQMAKSHDIEVLIDGAHTIGQIDIDLEDIGCDYFASSLHKWLNAPLGSGVLYIKQDRIPSHKPHISFDPKLIEDKKKYEYLGTRAFQNLMCLGPALDFLELTGIKKKEKRLKALSNYWIDALSSEKGLQIYTDKNRYCAVVSMGLESISAGKIKKILNSEFGVHVKSSGYPGRSMIRVSPNIYTNFEDLDKFIEGIRKINASQ